MHIAVLTTDRQMQLKLVWDTMFICSTSYQHYGSIDFMYVMTTTPYLMYVSDFI